MKRKRKLKIWNGLIAFVLLLSMLMSGTLQVNAATPNDTNATFENDGGTYSYEYILKNYAIFSFDDLHSAVHINGPIIAKGDLSKTGSISLGDKASYTVQEAPVAVVDAYNYFMQPTPPIYVGGKALINGINVPLDVYLGTSNKVTKPSEWTFVNGNQLSWNSKTNAYLTDSYVDWQKAESVLKSQSNELMQGSTRVVDTLPEGKNYVVVHEGENITIAEEVYKNPNFLYVLFVSKAPFDTKTTVVNYDVSGTVVEKEVRWASSELETHKSLAGIAGYFPGNEFVGSNGQDFDVNAKYLNFIHNYPSATEIRHPNSLATRFGQLYAINAVVYDVAGNVNGNTIAKKFVTTSETHMWPLGQGFAQPEKPIISIPVTKQWVGKVGNSATVKLMADGIEKYSVTLTASNNWKHIFADLPKYDATDGHEISYTLTEVKVDGYNTSISGDAENGFTITNTVTGKISIPVTKKWVGEPADKIIVNLFADGKKVDSQTLSKENNWQYTFKDLDLYKDGKKIVHTVDEVKVDGYNTSISGDMENGFIITNTVTGKISIPVTKKWVGEPADKIIVHLFADGKKVDSQTLSKENNWQYTFKDLDLYKDGKKIVYTVDEEKLDGYNTSISGDMENGFTITNTVTGKISIPVTKKWVGEPADKIIVHLFADGKKVDSQTLSKENNWQYTFKDLDLYKEGKKIVYTVDEERVDGYNTSISGDMENGFTITNTVTGKISIPVTKKWVGEPADKVIVHLFADGKKVDSQTLSKDNNWQYTFKDLDLYKDGKKIVYTVDEEKVDGYNTSISGDMENGFTITNTITGKISIPVTKKWVGEPGNKIIVHLFADGKKVDSQTLSKDNNWQYTFKDLDLYKDGKKIVYTVDEEKLDGYQATITGNAESGFLITNTKDIPNKPTDPTNPTDPINSDKISKGTTELPKTGDNSDILLPLIGFILLASGLVLLTIGRKKQSE